MQDIKVLNRIDTAGAKVSVVWAAVTVGSAESVTLTGPFGIIGCIATVLTGVTGWQEISAAVTEIGASDVALTGLCGIDTRETATSDA